MKSYRFCLLLTLFVLSIWLIKVDISLAQEPNETSLFIDSRQRFGAFYQAGLGDLDSDGDLDAFFVFNNGREDEIWLNSGNGNFIDSGQRLGQRFAPSAWYLVELGDLDADGDLDAVVANTGHCVGPHRVLLNDGFGVFNDNGQAFGNATTTIAIKLGDLDNDGDLDALASNGVWLNNGRGNFTDSGQNFSVRGVDLGDLDNDGDLDAFVVNGVWLDGKPDQVWLNDGNALFINSGQLLGKSISTAIKLGDLDNDGDLDAIVTTGEYERNIVWMNEGNGKFDASGDLGSSMSSAVALGDLDNDGDLDAFLANVGLNEVWLNNGEGEFINSKQDLGREGDYTSVTLGDLDNDGDLDAFIGNNGRYTGKLWLNETYKPPVEMPETGANSPIYNLSFLLTGLGFFLLRTGMLVRRNYASSHST